MLKAWMLEHTQCLLHCSLTLSPCECSGMHLCILSLLLVLWAALTHGAQLRCFRCLFTLLASEIPLKKGSVSGCPQWGLCFSYVRVLMCVLMCITATCILWCVQRVLGISKHPSANDFGACMRMYQVYVCAHGHMGFCVYSYTYCRGSASIPWIC